MIHTNKQQNNAGRRAGLVLALAVLISAATLATGPIRESSAQADAPSWSYTGGRQRSSSTLLDCSHDSALLAA